MGQETKHERRSQQQWVLSWLSGYRPNWLRLDILAGLTASAVVVPKCMAFAAIAGLPVETGLYAAFVPMIIYALLGTSRVLSVSTTTTIAILVATELAVVTPGGSPGERAAAAATLAVLVGGFLILAGILRLGFIANFISDPVLTGFKAGIGLVIIVDQLPKLLGFHIAKTGFFRDLLSIVHHIPETIIPTLILALITLGLVFGLEHFLPRFPAPLLAVVLGIAGAAFLGLKQAGVELIGSISGGLPALALPDLSLAGKLWPGALGIALMAFTESVAAGRAFVRQGDPHPEANRELMALGLANLGGGLFQAMPSGGGTSQTAVNSQSGARSQAAALVTVAVVIAVLLFLAPLVALMPQATLAAVVIATTVGLLSPRDFRAIARIRHMELWWALVAFAGVVLLGTLQGILVAVAVSLLVLLSQSNHPPLYAMGRKPGTDIFRPLSSAHPEDETFPGLLIVRTEGRMTFASAPRVGGRLWELIHEAHPQVLVFDFDAVPDIEYTALKMLTEFEEKLREGGVTLWLAALNPAPLKVIERSPLGKALGRERLFYNLQQAIEAFQAQSGKA
jgi:SulP family sulfate permease